MLNDLTHPKAKLGAVLVLAVVFLGLAGCNQAESSDPLSAAEGQDAGSKKDAPRTGKKTGILLVSHGSHSAEWRQMLLEFHKSVEPQLLNLPNIAGVKTAFMEYTEPSIATGLKEFDEEGYDNIILVPLLLTVSSHSFDDIPTIIGAKEDAKSMMLLKAEGIARYSPKAKVTITPLLDFSLLLQENLPRRIAALSKDPAQEGVVLVAYGSEPYNEEWEDFFTTLGTAVKKETGVAAVTHCWCGHIARYSGKPTKDAIRKILSQKKRALVIPVLVARDQNFQDKIIGGAVEEMDKKDQIAYIPDAILPDPTLNDWVVSITRKTCEKLYGTEVQADAAQTEEAQEESVQAETQPAEQSR